MNQLQRALSLRPNEVKATLASFAFVFLLMTAYYLLRPVRDAMASDWSDAEVSWLWTINFFISALLVAIYGWVIDRIQIRHVVPLVYGFFALSFVLFYIFNQQHTELANKMFYLWVSVFALFHMSVFWSLMSDTYNSEQATRLFSVIATGASIGAIAGPLLAAQLIKLIPLNAMILVAALLLLLPLAIEPCLRKLKHSELNNKEGALENNDSRETSDLDSLLAGFKEFFSTPYLLAIGVLIVLYTGVGSFIYLELKNLLAEFSLERRAQIYSYRDAITNLITLVLGLFITGRLVPKLGMPLALSLVPVLLMLGMLALAMSPILIMALGLWVVRSAGNYGLARPAREMLFTKVSRHTRFQTKPVIDIVAYRGGDVIMAWFFTALTQGLQLGMAAVAVVGAGIASLWVIVAWWLGKHYEQMREVQ